MPGQTLHMITGSEEEAVAEGEEVKELPEGFQRRSDIHACSFFQSTSEAEARE